jgi:hypothetical protein
LWLSCDKKEQDEPSGSSPNTPRLTDKR